MPKNINPPKEGSASKPGLPYPACAPSTERLVKDAITAAKARKFEEAEKLCRKALTEKPDECRALAILGTIRSLQGEHTEARDYLTKACEIRAEAGWLSNLSGVYRQLDQIERSLELGMIALKHCQDNDTILCQFGLTLAECRKFEDAQACFLRAIGLRHDHGDAHMGLAQMLLQHGQYRVGWKEYEWRLKSEQGKQYELPKMTSAPWNGMKLRDDAKIVVVADQGYGDCFQFGRFLKAVHEKCPHVYLACSPELEKLMAAQPYVEGAFTDWTKTPLHTCHARLTSLPDLLGMDTHEKLIDNECHLTVLPEWASAWDMVDGQPGKKIGMVWDGRKTHPNNSRRSVGRDKFLAAFEGFKDNATFVSLQVPEVDTGYALDYSSGLTDFSTTAGLIHHLDLVIGIDTGVCHLAASMGKEVWIIVPHSADWRWGMNGQTCDWYSKVKVFRQPKPGDWEGAFEEVKMELTRYLG